MQTASYSCCPGRLRGPAGTLAHAWRDLRCSMGRKDSWPKIGADLDRRQYALMMLVLNRTRNCRSATDPERTLVSDYFAVDAEGLLVERPSIRTMLLAFSIFRSCKILFTRVHSPSVKYRITVMDDDVSLAFS